ncbi:outer membrane protein assembly factor BamB family protein [Streptomyces aureocirculatus]|uniref:outer membrane protein assembly factor BamB family protein n=1 Tax=Streptomyces aureocirculatus TaxID=67275 RepID=UPI00099E1A41|nr:PQQ-binding-like beta-propeller repeat protein [Streptomyces aureocirculatus]
MVSRDHGPGPVPPPQPEHRPVPGNPYAQPPSAPGPARAGRGRAFGIGAGALALLLVGAGAFVLTQGDDDGSGSRKAAASESPRTPRQSEKPEKSGRSDDKDRGDDKGRGDPGVVDVNAGRGPGDAEAWVAVNDIELPGKGAMLFDLWHADGIVAQAEYDEVTGFSADDGTKKWSVRVPGEVCDTPVNASPDGKVAVLYTKSKAKQTGKCNQLQVIDLRTGEKGWHKQLVEHGLSDSTSMAHVAVSGSTVMVDQDSTAHAYRLRDGKRLYTTKMEREGACFLRGVAGGSGLLQVQSCAAGSESTHGRLKRLDPRTGKVKWVYRSKKGWTIDKVYSVDPAVVTLRNRESTDKWAVAAVGARGEQRSWIEFADREKFEMCTGAGDSGEGVQNCPGGVVSGDTLYLAGSPKDGILGPSRIAAFDLATGSRKWSAGANGRQLVPVAASGGDRGGVIVYARASLGKTGQTLRFGPGGGKPKVLLRHTAAAEEIESGMFAGITLYAEGRFYVSPTRLDGKAHGGKGEEGNGRLLSFGKP